MERFPILKSTANVFDGFSFSVSCFVVMRLLHERTKICIVEKKKSLKVPLQQKSYIFFCIPSQCTANNSAERDKNAPHVIEKKTVQEETFFKYNEFTFIDE